MGNGSVQNGPNVQKIDLSGYWGRTSDNVEVNDTPELETIP